MAAGEMIERSLENETEDPRVETARVQYLSFDDISF
jgi:hypothetical protein